MNDYEAKQDAKRERYEKKAEQLRAEAERLHEQAHQMAEAIPFGQPILVGHYSEGRDRRYRERIHNTFGKAFATMDKADHYEQKAASVGTGGISSDDPEAVNKLKEKLESLKRSHEWMKNVNAVIRKGKAPDTQIPALVALGMTEAQAAELLKPDFCGRIGFAPYSLQNSNANILAWNSESENWNARRGTSRRSGSATAILIARTRTKTGSCFSLTASRMRPSAQYSRATALNGRLPAPPGYAC